MFCCQHWGEKKVCNISEKTRRQCCPKIPDDLCLAYGFMVNVVGGEERPHCQRALTGFLYTSILALAQSELLSSSFPSDLLAFKRKSKLFSISAASHSKNTSQKCWNIHPPFVLPRGLPPATFARDGP